MPRPMRYRGRDLNNPAEYPARYESDWLHRRQRRVVARAVVVIVTFAVFYWPLGWRGALTAAVLAGVIHLLYFWRRHHAATAWHKDAFAERKSVRVLRPLERQGYLVLHDHRIGDARIQTLLIGPTGLWLVHAVGEALQRRLWGNAAFLHPEKKPLPPAPDVLCARAEAIAATLSEQAGEPVTVQPVYMAVGETVPAFVRKGEVPVVAKGLFRSYLGGEPTRLSPERIDRLVALAGTALPAEQITERPMLPPMAVKKTMWSRGGKGAKPVRETEIVRPDHRRSS